ncbi:hypothetical protein [Mesobacillus harenae]|uniref:hypothetical protein n=1 Tax=Mesobacillus harenae TaxID=2213203 RepID=UPI001580DC34|nr:hypothetical protein [Mesobacillus harenae]
MAKKAITAMSIFAVLFSGGWVLNERSQHEFYEREEEVVDAIPIQSLNIQKQLRFRPREYVRIITS